MTAHPERVSVLARLRPGPLDIGVAVALTAVALIEVTLTEVVVTNAGFPRPQALLVAVLLAAPLAWRRTLPLAVVVVLSVTLTGVALGERIRDYSFIIVSLILALYAVGAYQERRRAGLGLVVWLAGLAVTTTVEGTLMSDYLFVGGITAAAWAAGLVVRDRGVRAAASEDRALRAEQDREERAAAAVTEERARIARELHDLVAHSVSVMVMQSGALRRMLAADQDRERELVGNVERTGRQALGEMRRMLGLLRDADAGGEPLAPQPGLARIDELVDGARAGGLPVSMGVHGKPVPLLPALDLCAYRIVQEAVTNVLKHARASSAQVQLRYSGSNLEIVVTDDGRGPVAAADPGHGLIGMQERVTLFGGELWTGAAPGGGFCVRAVLPLEGR